MNPFKFIDQHLYIENIKVANLAKIYGTPAYIYSANTIKNRYLSYAQNMPKNGLVCYAVKANSNLAILQLLAKMGAGFDIVSGGELARVLKAGANAQQVVFSGVGKTADEMQQALNAGIYCFNLESYAEGLLLQQVALKLNKIAPVALRINPNIDAGSHPYIATGLKENKFGIDIEDALSVYLNLTKLSHLKIIGIDCHIGSQLTEISPFITAIDCVLNLINELKQHNINLTHIDLGGGLGVTYNDEQPPAIAEYLTAITAHLAKTNLKLIIEPGRSIVATAGILLTEVLYLKSNSIKNFAIVDAGMNDLIRPALYEAYMQVINTYQGGGIDKNYDIVGPVCETGDFLARTRELNINAGDYLAVMDAGAYGYSMSSNYNSRPRAVEVLVDNDQHFLIRKRERVADLFALENLI